MTGASASEGATHDFRDELVSTLPHLRAFARSLCGDRDIADDLVQETAVKAWTSSDRFTPGTNMRAWTFTILRNTYYSYLRQRKHALVSDGKSFDHQESVASAVAPEQEDALIVADLQSALAKLPPDRRTALLLVSTGDFSYEEAAAICDCPVGTIRSRVARARSQLGAWLKEDSA